jgi:hypothetical protein
MTDTNSSLKRFNENCLLVKIATGLPGQTYTSKQASNDAAMVNRADKSRIKTSLLKFTNADLKPVRFERDTAKALLFAVSVPWDKEGRRIIQVTTYQNIITRLRDHRARFFDARDRFIAGYTNKVNRASRDLTHLFEASRFPSAEEVGNQFSFEIETESITDPEDIRIKGSLELVEEVKLEMERKQIRKLNESKDDIVSRLTERIKTSIGSIRNFHEKTAKGEDTKFFESALTGITALCKCLPDLNITGDADIANFGQKIQKELGYMDAELIKDSPDAREIAINAGDSILDALENYSPDKFA